METTNVLPAPRQAADERRNAIIDAAIVEFAVSGLHGTPTETIARRAGISQPSIFRLFGSKQELFLAALERVSDRIASTFRAAAGATDGGVLEAMGHSYATVLAGRDELFLLLQAVAASSDRGGGCGRRDIGCWRGGATPVFRALAVVAAIDLPHLVDTGGEGWVDIAAIHSR